MARRRVVIVDVMHLAYRAAFGGMPPLSVVRNYNGQSVQVSTTIPTYIVKRIWEWSKGGSNPTVVCFDSPNGSDARKSYFQMLFGADRKEGVAYKSGRKKENDLFYTGCNLTMDILYQGGVSCVQGQNYEADDLIKASVDMAKVQFPDLPIHIITGDADLVPLVDEQVSVFLSSKKATYAVEEDEKIRNYVQITPDNYQGYIESLTSFKNLYVPYNTVLLAKLLRGDKSDAIPGYPKFTPTKYRDLVFSMQCDGVDIANICRYGNPVEEIVYKATGVAVPEQLRCSTPVEQMTRKYTEPKELTELCNVLSNYLTDENIIKHVRDIYNGINLNTAFMSVPNGQMRRPARLSFDIQGYDGDKLRISASEYKIQLSKKY